jgi:hypothetical protein
MHRRYKLASLVGLAAALGLAAPGVADEARWMQVCTAHGSVWKLVDLDGGQSPSRERGQGACHSGCTLPRKIRIGC